MSKQDITRLRKNRLLHFQAAFIFSLSFVLAAFNYTTDTPPLAEETFFEVPIDLDISIERTAAPKPTPPPPIKAPAEKIEVVDELPMEEPTPVEDPKPIEVPIDKAVKVVKVKTPVKAPIVIPDEPTVVDIPEEVVEPDFYVVVAEMPSFPGCEGESIHQCKTMLEYIYSKIEYPAIARENGIEGLTVIQFIIDTDGSITDVKTLKPLGGGCSKEAERVVKSMPTWSPGKQRNKAVRVQFNLPINFKLAK